MTDIVALKAANVARWQVAKTTRNCSSIAGHLVAARPRYQTVEAETGVPWFVICRVGVLRKHCGCGLQLRLMRAVELRARNNGWSCVVSDTTDNVVSANNFIRAGYRLYRPQQPWAWPNTLYWRKPVI
jgi:lysozyme family protein